MRLETVVQVGAGAAKVPWASRMTSRQAAGAEPPSEGECGLRSQAEQRRRTGAWAGWKGDVTQAAWRAAQREPPPRCRQATTLS